MPDAEVTVEYLCDHIWLVGDPDTVAEKLSRLATDVGGFGVLLVIAHEWTPWDAWSRSMRLLHDQVLPRL
jgi:alkanesulfonate monooxygenase SsuD/methylene tetrahydromethanopterin reductase-like flavin-dependent oxidoreductase (luciferase family)